MATPTLDLGNRALAMLRAVAAGRAELSCSCEPDLYVDGLPCCDQVAARELVHAGLINAARPGTLGHRVPAVLTGPGRAVLMGRAAAEGGTPLEVRKSSGIGVADPFAA